RTRRIELLAPPDAGLRRGQGENVGSCVHVEAPRVAPPSTQRLAMVMCRASSDRRNTTAAAMSDGSAMRRSGMPRRYAASEPSRTCWGPTVSSQYARCIAVSVEPGETTLQRTCGASSRARQRVNITAAAFDAAYADIATRGTAAALEAT